ncbi:hypothetical protein QJ857_gp0170 [Tupanvirus soda lake]|uniref:Ankyrin repeat protein n=2 Tax=Tupanvirus TaxID=2094720 RepID=A0A6N1NNA3_9VIRU|nr:hypothetical protein QJ857_gp0170 [Tupanvirus soda lake]QKU35854.1 hypothetical protein [Tupanvirus soda lake]
MNTYLDVICEGSCEQLKNMLDGDNYDVENNLLWIATKVVEHGKSDMFKMLVLYFSFDVTEEFIKKNCQYITMEILEFINDIKGTNSWDYLDHIHFNAIFCSAYRINNKDIIIKLINYGININNLPGTYHTISYYSTNLHIESLKILLDNGLKHEYFDKETLGHFVRFKYDKLLNLLLQYGIRFDVLNKFDIPDNFSQIYDVLVGSDVDPKSLAYILSVEHI